MFETLETSSASEPQSMRTLSVVSVQATNIPPKETIFYAKQTQTLESGSTRYIPIDSLY